MTRTLRHWLNRSLTTRLAWFTGLATLLVWAILSISTLIVLRDEFGEMLDHRLQHVARMLLDFDAPGTTQLARHKKDRTFNFAIYDKDGRLLASKRQPPLPLLPPEEDRRSRRLIDYQGERWHIAMAHDEERTVVVGELSDWQDELLEEMLEHLGWPAAISALLLLGALYLAVRRALGPLRELQHELAARSPADLTPLTSPVPAEIKPLTQQLNQLFAAVSNAMAREKRFTADAAHELRTPLAALQIQLEVASQSPRPDARERALQNALTGVQRTTQLVNQLLDLARLEHLGQLDTCAVDLNQLVREAADANDASDEIRIDGSSEFRPVGDAGLLRLLLRNLIDNSLRYGKAPVVISLQSRGFTVTDSGPGVAPDVLARLGERFFRPPGQAQTGAGLGLSIVQRISTLHGASLDFANRQEGGFAVSVRWPELAQEASHHAPPRPSA